MGKRYVWGKYTAVQQIGYRTRYQESSETLDSSTTFTAVESGSTIYIGTGYSFSKYSGSYSITGLSSYVLKSSAYEHIGIGYISFTTGLYYGKWANHYGKLILFKYSSGVNATHLTATSYQEQYYYYVQGSFIRYVSSANSGQYPSNSDQGGYYYVLEGSDNVDPKAVTIPAEINDGTSISVTLTPSDGKQYSGTITYTYQYKFGSGRWTNFAQNTGATSQTLEIPIGTTSVQVRARAQDDLGFTSGTWIKSEAVTVHVNQPPTAPAPITVDNVFAGETLTVTLTESVDEEGSVTGYTIERRIDGGAWTPVQSDSMLLTYSELTNPDWATVAYRAYATDDRGLKSDYATSETFDVNPGWVIIEGPSSELGEKTKPFHFMFSVAVAGHPAQDDIVTVVMLDDRYKIVSQVFHADDIIDIRLDLKYFAAGAHKLQITANKEGYTGAMSTYNFNVTNAEAETLLAGASANVAQNSEGKPIVHYGLARYTFGPDGRDVIQMCGDGLKMSQGTYTGSGTNGSSAQNKLVTGFRPKTVTLYKADGSASLSINIPDGTNSDTAGAITWTASDTGFNWYAASADAQFNASGTQYGYQIIG